MYVAHNGGKKGLCLDLTQPEGLAVAGRHLAPPGLEHRQVDERLRLRVDVTELARDPQRLSRPGAVLRPVIVDETNQQPDHILQVDTAFHRGVATDDQRQAADIAKPPADTADKDAILAGLKASFAECDKAFAATTDANFTEMFTVGQGKRSRAGLLWGTVSHDNEQYATLALYLRLKGLTPPSSEK